MKVVLIADTHFGARNENREISNYFNKFLKTIFFPYLIEHDIKNLIHLGDLVDKRRTINYVILNNIRKNFISPLFDLGIDSHFIIGNHDTFYKNTNSINAITELYGNESFISIYDNFTTTSMFMNDLNIDMIPWICNENKDEILDKISKTESRVAMGHLALSGFQMERGRYSSGDNNHDKNIFGKYELVCSGHFHYRSSNKHIHYLGSPYQITWSDYNVKKGFHVLDTETLELEFVVNPFTIFDNIYYDDLDYSPIQEILTTFPFENYSKQYLKLNIINKTDSYIFEQFLEKLYSHNPIDIQIIEDVADFLEDGAEGEYTKDTITILSEYISNLQIDLNKDILQNLVHELYSEAENLI